MNALAPRDDAPARGGDAPARSGDAPVLVVDIGGTKIAWALATPGSDAPGSPDPGVTAPRLSERGAMPTRAAEGGAALAACVCELAAGVASAHGGPGTLSGVAIASAGVVDPGDGSIVSATDTIPGWGGTRLGDLVRDATGLPVSVLNDVHAHGLGEASVGAGRDHDSVLVAAVGTGIGGAFVEGGEVRTGAHHLAGHIGHVHHALAAGMPCTCGRTGHIEGICSGTGLAVWYLARRGADGPGAFDEEQAVRDGEELVRDGADVARLAAGGDPLAREVVADAGWALGESLGSLANCLDPALVLLTGSVTALGEPWWSRVRAGYAAAAMDGVAGTPLREGALGSDAPLIGAAVHHARTTRPWRSRPRLALPTPDDEG